jgi:hypothetical protein
MHFVRSDNMYLVEVFDLMGFYAAVVVSYRHFGTDYPSRNSGNLATYQGCTTRQKTDDRTCVGSLLSRMYLVFLVVARVQHTTEDTSSGKLFIPKTPRISDYFGLIVDPLCFQVT